MLLVIIVACEIGFWVLIGAGLTARYLLRRPRLGAGLLMSARSSTWSCSPPP